MLLIFVTFDVLNKGTEESDEQLLNMLLISEAFDVLNKGTDGRDTHDANMRVAVVIDAVFSPVKLFIA